MENRSGFTLLEIGIVLTIIGLIIGGIVVGRDAIRNSELQAVVSDINRYKNAVRLFKDKYHDLPGDKPDAHTFWGTDPNSCPDNTANATPATTTCDGNGDGFIGDSTSTPITMGGTNYRESIRAWQQLADAGFIEGTYSGVTSSRTSGGLDPGMNIPISKLNGNGYTLFYSKPTNNSASGSNTAGVFGANYGHIIVYGATTGLAITTPSYLAGLTAVDAMNIDTKIDDGLPGTGNVLSYTSASTNTPSCATTAVETTAAYAATVPGLTCSLIFITGF